MAGSVLQIFTGTVLERTESTPEVPKVCFRNGMMKFLHFDIPLTDFYVPTRARTRPKLDHFPNSK